MSDYGIIETGFNRKRLDVLLDELNSEMGAIFGENFDTSPESPDGQVDGVVSESNANLWEIAEESYNAFNPSAATGATLSNLVQLNGITRLAATGSRAGLTLTGTTGAVIPLGSLVSTSDTNAQFQTEAEVTLDVGGNAGVIGVTVKTGEIIALAGTITNIDTPVTGWDTVTNATDATVGRDEEKDPELRARRSASVGLDAQAQIDAIYAAVANVEGVTSVTVLENDTNLTDANGLPPHSFQVIVVGGIDADIGNVIWLKKPAGITSFGATTVQINDSQSIPHDISFSRPTEVDIYVIVNVSTFANYPITGDDDMKQAIVDYANGDLIEGRDFGLSDDVIFTRMYTPINSVQGHEITSLFIGTSPAPTGTANITIAATEISNFIIANITVNS